MNECIVLASRNGSIIVFLISYFIALQTIHDTTHKYQGKYGSLNTSHKGPQLSQKIPGQTISLLERLGEWGGGAKGSNSLRDGRMVGLPPKHENIDGLCCAYTLQEKEASRY